MPSTSPTLPSPTWATRRWKPKRPSIVAPRAAEIIIDQDDALAIPPEVHGPIHQGVLQARRFLVALHLLGRGLAHVDDRQALTVPVEHLARPRATACRPARFAPHRRSPR